MLFTVAHAGAHRSYRAHGRALLGTHGMKRPSYNTGGGGGGGGGGRVYNDFGKPNPGNKDSRSIVTSLYLLQQP